MTSSGARPQAGPAESPARASALSGLRVLELGSLIAGPFAGRLLADFGAEVIKVEDPRHPDPLREWGQAHVEGNTLCVDI
jgi:formyl-CoA transferase